MISFLVGTTAELIKIAPVYHAVKAAGTRPKLWFTAQHVDEVDDVLSDLDMHEPDVWLVPKAKAHNLETPAQVPGWALTVARNAWRRRAELRAQLTEDGKPPLVIVHGDTFTTPGGAFIGKRFLGARVAHVEAGCRSGSLLSPLPEEINRKIAAKIVDLHFAPSAREAHNLRKARGAVIDTGANTAIDAMRLAIDGTPADDDLPEDYGLATLHRFELLSRPDVYRDAMNALKEKSAEIPIVYFAGAHERERMERAGIGDIFDDRFILRPKTRYLKFLPLVARAKFVVTDSGGLGAECFYLGKPCAIHRERTESPQHIGETVVLTGMRKADLDDFLATYKDRVGTSMLDEFHPTQIIIDTLRTLGYV
ncbi:MAG TPA: UDP-N-acetylglucosamine 2-epimerase [Actinokineospora sp.]|nr:UDP-N-acetylglucosamine 2-epimerase [Actinokineospora sp.]